MHPFTGKQIPIWVGDYVLAGYGTGAVMAVPAHDERDFKFANYFGLPLPQVIEPTKEHDFAKDAWGDKEGKLINKILNDLQNNSSEYIDCNTNKKKRNDIIEKYKNGNIPFLVNVRILVEGFDAPITKGVCFLHLPHSQTTLIQIIGRCLRLHPTKNIANIILPFSSKGDEDNICNFLKVMSKNDSRIRKSYENKQLGGYISIENINNSYIYIVHT